MATVAGVFATRDRAAQAIHALRDAGFDVNRMGLVMREPAHGHSAQSSAGAPPGVAVAPVAQMTGGALAGAIVGGALGAILGATGLLVVPGIGSFIAAGVLASAVVGVVAGWLVGALVGLGIPHEQAQAYQMQVEQGAVLVTVDANGREQVAQHILADNGTEHRANPEEQPPDRPELRSDLPRTAPLRPRRKIEPEPPAPPSAEMPPSGVADTTTVPRAPSNLGTSASTHERSQT